MELCFDCFDAITSRILITNETHDWLNHVAIIAPGPTDEFNPGRAII